MRNPALPALLAAALLASVTSLQAQTATATLSGTVTDATGAVIPGVPITVTNVATGLKQTASTSSAGLFTIPLLPTGTYTLSAQHPGFAPVEIDNVVLALGAHVALDVRLQPSAVKESVMVTADAGQIQLKTESGERSDVIVNRQVRDLALPGRNYLYLAQTIPGIVPNGDYTWGNMVVNGNRATMKDMSIDGASNLVTGANNALTVGFDPEIISEMKVLTSNFQAEYGKAGSAFVQITTRSGTRQFHGGLRYYRRDGALNANDFFNNAQGVARPAYRYNYYGYDVGGPIIVPHTGFNKDRNKLFFFWSQQWYRQFVPQATNSLYTPTQAERSGDFSKSTDGNGNRINITDPATGSPFPGNVIPANRFFKYGQNILSILPTPNTSVGGAKYNYISTGTKDNPSREDIVRVDYNISEKTRLTGRLINNSNNIAASYAGGFNLAWNYPLATLQWSNPPFNTSFSVVHTFSPTFTNEFIFGYVRYHTQSQDTNPALLKATYGINFPLLFNNAPGSEYLPTFQFGGIANQTAPGMQIYALPRATLTPVSNFVDNLMKVTGDHMFKVGIFIERSLAANKPPTSTNATINFANNAANPLNTGNPYANALLGIYSSYAQANTDLEGEFRFTNVEPYIQDTWKVTRRFTLDVGMRFSWIPPLHDSQLQANYFVPAMYDPAKAVRLYQPVLVGSTRRAVDPANAPAVLTAQNTLPTAYIGLIVPGSGNPANGIQQAKNGYYAGGFQDRGVQLGPRFGFAWDVTGKGKLVVRGGYGISYDRVQGNVANNQINTLPTVQTPQLLYGYLADLPGSSGFMAPSGLQTYAPDGKIPNVQSFSIGLQRNLGFGTVLDVAYVGTLGRHLDQSVNLNGLPYLTTFQRSAQDPSMYTGGVVPAVEPNLPAAYARAGFNFAGDRALPVDFLRPYPGYGDISYRQFVGSSNYHALQVSARRAIGHRLTFGLAYTFSKAMNTADADFNANNVYNTRAYDYKVAAYDRTHVLVINYVYDLPRVALHFTGAKVVNSVLSQWHVSGLSQFSSGAPFELGFTISGVNTGQRVLGTYSIAPMLYRAGGAAQAANGLQIDPNAYYVPNIGDAGPYPRNYLRQPFTTNHDISVYKNIPLAKDTRRFLQLRVEMFNAFNHTEFNSVNSSVQLTANGVVGNNIFNSYPNVAITNNLRPAGSTAPPGQYFGEYNGARDPRIIQLGAKVYF